MIVTVMLGFLFVKGLHWSITYGMLLALTIGFWLIACLEFFRDPQLFPGKTAEDTGGCCSISGNTGHWW